MFSLRNAIESDRVIATRRTLMVACTVLGLTTTSMANAEIFRYKEGGRVVYGDSIPFERANNRHTIFNTKGVAVREVKSLQERRADLLKAQKAEAQRLRDNGLLQTYTTEEDLIIARDEKVAHIDDQMQQLDARALSVEESLRGIERNIRAEETINGAGNASANLYSEQKRAKNKIEATRSLIEVGVTERKELVAKYESDLERYQWLKSNARTQ